MDGSGSKAQVMMKRKPLARRSLYACQLTDWTMRVPEREQRDWFLIPLLLGIGFLLVIMAGGWALRFSPRWTLKADMASNLDPNRDFLTRRPSGLIEPVDPPFSQHPSGSIYILRPMQ